MDDLRSDIETADGLTILAEHPGHYVIAAWGAVAIVRWMRQADGPAMKRVHESFAPVVKAHPRGVSFVHLVEADAGLPDAGARRALAEMMVSFAETTVGVGVLLMGNGFWASAMQSLLTGMRLVAPPRPWTMRFASRTSELSDWLPHVHEQRTKQRIDRAELEAVLNSVLAYASQRRAANG